MSRTFFYFLIMLSVKASAADSEIYIEPEIPLLETAQPIFFINPFTPKILRVRKSPTDYDYNPHDMTACETTLLLEFVHEGKDYLCFPKDSKIRISFDKRRFDELYSIIKKAQRDKKMLQINSQLLRAKDDLYHLPEGPMELFSQSNVDVAPFGSSENNSFRCPRKEIYPVHYFLLSDIVVAYKVSGRYLSVRDMNLYWTQKLEEICRLDPAQEIKVSRYIENPQQFYLVDPDLVFLITKQIYKQGCRELDPLI